ncbi:hypothetical protein AB0H42_07075 [Nocardia sp. NPDC050799]|uniref:hypothetical protein n=1 Tax=Nocardia sp. NPDC050799 TaxID=3154842 RepID=UPI0033F63A70
MTEDGASVDSVTGELATRLGTVGGYAGEAMRRGVRDAAGGAQTIALLVQADTAATQHLEPADTAAPTAPGGAEPPPPAALPPAGDVPPPADRPVPEEKSTETGAADHYRGSADRPTADASPESTSTRGAVGDRPVPDPGPAPRAAAEAHPAPDTTPAQEPSPKPALGPPAAEQHPAPPVPTTDDPSRADAAVPPGDPIAAAAGHTPWTPAGSEQTSGHPPGSTPWNSGTGSSMPYAPGMPGGLGSLTPQERPPRGSAPWSRGRGSKEETVFPRPRPDRSNSTNRTEWAPP